MTERYVAAIDQGTASSRCLIFDRSGRIVSVAQKEHRHIYPKPGWVEHDPDGDVAQRRGGRRPRDRRRSAASLRIWSRSESPTSARRPSSGTARPVSRCTTRSAGRTCAPITWSRELDRRARARLLPLTLRAAADDLLLRARSCAGCSTTCRGCASAREAGEVLFGTMDSWLIWRLTGRHLTDVTNASRTMLMNLQTLDWDDELLAALDVPRAMLPEIRPRPRSTARPAAQLRRRPGRRGAGRPAGGAVRADVLRPRRGQVHLRHRQLPAAQHRERDRSCRPAVC